MTKTLSLSIAAVLTLVLGSGAAAVQSGDLSSPKLRITWGDFKKLHDKKEVVIVDVRGNEAYEQGHIPGSRSIPLEEVGHRADELKKLQKPIVLYCA
jgi:3-mercaptopyruvate sulfurtransferase SseA